MTEPGWYTDPRDSSQYRYWDGTSWTEAVAPGAAAESFAVGAADQESGEAGTAFDTAADAVTEQAEGVTDQAADAAESVADDVTDSFDSAAGGLTDQLESVTDDASGSFGSAIDTAAGSATDAFDAVADKGSAPLDFGTDKVTDKLDLATGHAGDQAGAVLDNAAGAVGSAGLSVDEALLDLDPAETVADAASSVGATGHSIEEVGQGISVDDVLGDVDVPFTDASETMVVDVPDFKDAPDFGEVGIPGDGVSFSSPIDSYGSADQTAVIPGTDLPVPDGGQTPDADHFGAPPPNPAGFGGPGNMAPPAPGFESSFEQNIPASGFGPPPGGVGEPQVGFDAPQPDQFGGQPPPGGPGFESGQVPYPDQPGPRALVPPQAAPSKSRTPWIVLGVIGLAIVAVLAFLAIRSPGRTSVDSIAEGQCFADFDQFEATEIRSSVSSADCVEEHALEVFEVTDDPYRDFSDYPGEQVITDLAFRHCLDGFEAFVGTTYEDSTLDVWALYPTEGSWNLNSDREVVCMVGAFDQTLTTGTLRGSGQ